MVIKILDSSDASTLQTFSGFITIFFDGLAVRPGDGLLFATGSGGVHTIDLGTSTQTTLSPGPQNGDTMSDLDFRPATTAVPALPGGAVAVFALVVCLAACGIAAERRGTADRSARG